MENTTFNKLGALLSQAGLLTATSYAQGETTPDLPLTGADCDSRQAAPGHLFICKGAAFRPDYLTKALDAGAVAYLCEEERAAQLAAVAPTVPALMTNDIRTAMALVSAEAWGHPDQHMRIAGITGTKGKTTVAYFVRAILDGDRPYSHAATLGTLETYDGVERMTSRNTTPEAPDLWRHLAHAADAHLSMVMEVSSQGLKYQRVEGLTYDVAAFLNIGVDHISPIEHPTFEDYLASKLKLFQNARTAVVNARLDPQHAERILAQARTCEQVLLFSLDGTATCDATPDIWASHVNARHDGTSFTVHTPTWTADVRIGLSGLFNVENALAAVAIAQCLGCTRDQILEGLLRCRVPGRMDVISSQDQRLIAIVDYAHNGMSVQNVLSSVRQSYPDRFVVAVFGATGGKGAKRRFEMPPAAAPYVDHLVFTEDDPGPESVELICEQMVASTPAQTPCDVVLDRTEAITYALELARASGREAVVCVLGKGHEARQLRAQGPAPMVPDGEVVRQLLA